jgi:hypothetical protein
MEFEFYSNFSLPTTAIELSKALGRNVKYINEYHPNIKPEHDCFLLTPDYSGGSDMVELITSPLSYQEARIVLTTVYKILDKIGYTDDTSGMHINISFKSKDITKINLLKLMLIMDETRVYDIFPSREDNIYCRSVKNYLPYSGFDYTDISPSLIASTFSFDTENRYYGINLSTIKNGRIEYRYIGGVDYIKQLDPCLDLLDYFVITTNNSFNSLTVSETNALKTHLDAKMKEHKGLSTLSGFIARYPNVGLEVNRNITYDYVNSFYSSIYEKLFVLLKSLKNITDKEKEFTINFDTENNQLEVVNYNGEITGLLRDVVFIRCEILGGDYTGCEFYNSEIKNANLTGSVTTGTDIYESKLLETNCVKYSSLTDCYFTKGFLDCEMTGGVYRDGVLGENGELISVREDRSKTFTKK